MIKVWQQIRQYFYKRALADAVDKQKPKREIVNLNDGKYIGIIYDSRDVANDAVVASFANQLRSTGKQVELLGYVSDKKTESKPGIQVLHKKTLNWAGVPTDEKTTAFAAKKFDLLLACFIGDNPSLEYIAATSKAKWRVGVYNKTKTDLYDMMVNTGGKADLQYLIEQMIHFLNKLNYDSN